MTDYYTREELEAMPLGTVLVDLGNNKIRKVTERWGWECDMCEEVHQYSDIESLTLKSVTYPEPENESDGEPTEAPESDEQAQVPTPTLGELIEALEWYTRSYSASRDEMDLRRVESIETMIDERLGL